MNLASLKRYMKLVVRLPIHQVIAKVFGKIRKIAFEQIMRRRDFRKETYGCGQYRNADAPLLCRFPKDDIGVSISHTTLAAITDLYLDHRFDLLGSGWVNVRHGMECNGLEDWRYPGEKTPVFDSAGHWLAGRINSSNLSYSQYVWSLIDGDRYMPIDWHIDFKSGYRWAESIWYRDIAFGHLPGVDVKVPWELARMQHLPQLAQAYAAAVDGIEGFAPAGVYADEFRRQVLDFIASNPPRFGVNWACSMDVGIRVANWLLAYDLFVSANAVFDEQFDDVFKLSVYQHGKHIVHNLEWHPVYRGNHYLADIVGLLFVSSYLASDPEIDAWLAFGVQELINEVDFQFYADGSNFEASTSYHRLSAELVVYATALVVGLPDIKRSTLDRYDYRLVTGIPSLRPAPLITFAILGGTLQSPFPEWYWERLEKMAKFTVAIMRPDEQSPQIGDNDSGRLFKLSPQYETLPTVDIYKLFANLVPTSIPQLGDTYWLEIHNDHRHLLAATYGLLECRDFESAFKELQYETFVVRMLAKNLRIPSLSTESGKCRPDMSFLELPLHESTVQRYNFSVQTPGLNQEIDSLAFPEFGLYLFKSKRLYLAIRCGSIGLNGLGAHAHNDSLGIELWLDKQPVVVDAGTYLYTSLPFRRDEFRSATAHFSPRVDGEEPNDLSLDIFRLGNEAKAECLGFTGDQFLGRYSLGHAFIYRHIVVTEKSVQITDWISDESKCLVGLDSATLPYSPGYGWRCH